MRACQPSRDGYVARDGVKVHYELFGDGEPAVMRHCRVLTFDGRGKISLLMRDFIRRSRP
jgi:hypothetical protein